MSLMNIYVEPSTAHVVVDTECSIVGDDTGKLRVENDKVHIFPAAQSMLVGVGMSDLLDLLALTLTVRACQDFDAMRACMADELGAIANQRGAVSPGVDLSSTVVLVGWSRQHGRMWAYAIDAKRQDSGAYKVRRTDAPEGAITPDVPGAPFHFAGRDSMVEHARRQVAYAREAFPGQACGGRLIAITMDQTSIQVQHYGPALP